MGAREDRISKITSSKPFKVPPSLETSLVFSFDVKIPQKKTELVDRGNRNILGRR
jgi:hypothetical protein